MSGTSPRPPTHQILQQEVGDFRGVFQLRAYASQTLDGIYTSNVPKEEFIREMSLGSSLTTLGEPSGTGHVTGGHRPLSRATSRVDRHSRRQSSQAQATLTLSALVATAPHPHSATY